MTTLRFVHLSDIHFGQSSIPRASGEQRIHTDVREQLVNDLKAMREKLGEADGIIVTGDIAYSGKKDEFDSAANWLDAVCAVVGCAKHSVKVVPGNHDVDLKKVGASMQMIHDGLREHDGAGLDSRIVEISKEEMTLVSKLEAYREFAASYDCDFPSAESPFWTKSYSLGGDYQLRFVGLNSVQISDLKDAPRKMVLGKNQYVIGRESNVEQVVLMHHPLEWFRDRESAIPYLHRARVILFGHEHLMTIEKKSNEHEERLEITAGAVNPPTVDSKYAYRYNWLEFKIYATEANRTLGATVYPRVWEQSLTRFVADQNRLGGRESVEFKLNCPNLNYTVESKESSGSGGKLDFPSVPKAAEVSQMKAGDEGFDRLKFFFWRYLDWNQRVTILVELNLLPKTPEKRLPQILEHSALDTAKREGRLRDLWEKVMAIVPIENREANPF